MLLLLSLPLFADPLSGTQCASYSDAYKSSVIMHNAYHSTSSSLENEGGLALWKRFLKEEDESQLLILAHLIVQRESKDLPNDYRGEFLWAIAPAALVSAKKNRIFPSVVLAQGILESGWGTSSLARNHNNLFGVKGKKGKSSTKVYTIESVGGKKVRRWAYFRHFSSWSDSISYHGRLLGSSHYYAFAKPIAKDARHYLELIAPRYASQPDYAEYVVQIIDEYNLDRWDRILWDSLL